MAIQHTVAEIETFSDGAFDELGRSLQTLSARNTRRQRTHRCRTKRGSVHNGVGQPLRLPFRSINGTGHAQIAHSWCGFTTLLDDVCQLMRQQSLSGSSFRRVLRSVEYNVAPYRVGECIHGPCRLCRPHVRVHANVAEIVTKARLHEFARVWIQWLAARAYDFMHDRRNGRIISHFRCGIADFSLQPFLPTFLAFACQSWRSTAGAFALQKASP